MSYPSGRSDQSHSGAIGAEPDRLIRRSTVEIVVEKVSGSTPPLTTS
jgi:hypothetical protein